MTTEIEQRWSELAPLLDTALELDPPQRDAWLAQQCTDPQLLNLLRRLLDTDARYGAGLVHDLDQLRDEGSDPDADDGVFETAPSAPQIEGYRVLQWLGSGGMASVFLAERALDGASQRVALKLLRLNVHDPRERRLFQREQAALARLEHPHIARLIDAGFAADGAPWLAMEYVDGDTLLLYCDKHKMDLRARAKLFLDVCSAVAAAHHDLVVHRDLKPANVLVRADGAVKLVDFGIAKLLGSDEEATRTELRRLTPGYAAPEQYRGEDHGTASDIYALGVILTELLCGCRPTARRDGTMPSLSTLPVDLHSAAARNDQIRSLRRSLRGDLDAIVARALRPEPRARYLSVEALAADLQAWLEHRPVSARRGNRRYRMAKFLRRQRIALALGAAFSLALLLFAITSLNFAHEAQRAAEQARSEAMRAQHVQDFVLGMFRGDENGIARGKARSAEELVARALAAARREFATQPEALVPLLTALGETERSLGHLEVSADVLGEAAALARRHFGDGDARTLSAEAELAHTRFRAGRYTDAMPQLSQAMAAYRAAGGTDNSAVVAALTRLAMLAHQVDDSGRALARAREAMTIATRILAPTHPQRLAITAIYGDSLARDGEFDESTRVLRENLDATRQAYGAHHIVTLSALESLATAYLGVDQPGHALALFEQAGRAADDSVPEANVIAAYVQNTWGVSLLRLGRSEEAAAHFARALELFHILQGERHPQLAATLDNLGTAALERGDFAAAEKHWTESSIMAHALGIDQHQRAVSMDCNRGFAQSLRGQHELARETLAQATAAADGARDDALLYCQVFSARAALAREDLARAAELSAHILRSNQEVAIGGIAPLLAHSVNVALAARSADGQRCAMALNAAKAHSANDRWPHFAARLWREIAADAQRCSDPAMATLALERAQRSEQPGSQ